MAERSVKDFTLGGALKTWQWWALWLLSFLNTSVGISIISQEVPMFQELAKITAIVAAGMVGIVLHRQCGGTGFLGVGVGHAGAWRMTFAVMFILQIGLFWFLPSAGVQARTTVAFIILMCYGGGFGTMPAFAADYFGPTNVSSIYGLILTAWGFASAFDPAVDRTYAPDPAAHMRADCT